jgi:hypothetical protein
MGSYSMILRIFNDAMSSKILHNVEFYSKTIMNGEQIRIWKEVVMAYLKVLS